MPLTKKGRRIKRSMIQNYGKTKGEQVFYASENANKIQGVTKDEKKKQPSRRR